MLKYNTILIVMFASISPLMCHMPSADFSHTLTRCNYAPYCIRYLREKYPQDIDAINAILEQRYFWEYRTAIAHLNSTQDKLNFLTGIQEHLLMELYWIDNGYEPCIQYTTDGTDRGVEGLRYKVLREIMKEVSQ